MQPIFLGRPLPRSFDGAAGWAARNILVATCYTASGYAGLKLAFVGNVVTLFWPPSGIAFAAIWLWGLGLLPAVLVGAFVLNVVVFGTAPLALMVAIGNALPATVATVFLRERVRRRFDTGGDDRLTSSIGGGASEVQGVLLFIFIAVLGSTILSASVGTLAVWISGQHSGDTTAAWLVWWMGDAMGVMIVAPPLLLYRHLTVREWSWTAARDAALFGLAGLAIITGLLIVRNPIWAVELCKLTTLLLSLWAGVRFGLNGPAAVTLLMACGGVWVTMLGVGPFARADFHDSFALLHSYLFAEAIAGLLLAAALTDLRRATIAEKHARSLAEAASANRIRLLTMIGHDVRTPLGGIMGALQVLRDRPRPDQHDRLVELGLRAGTTLTTLFGDIIDVARADAGRITLAVAPFDPALSLVDLVAISRQAASAKGIILVEKGFANLPPRVLGDRARFEQLFGNLLTNAVAYTVAGQVGVEATASDGAISITVRDTGPGIDPDRVATMFDAFVLAPQAGGASAGLGLGLHISRRLAERMGGTIVYRPAVGGGSVFGVKLPLSPVAPDDVARTKVADPSQAVLLVEDDPIALEVTQALIEARGHRVTTATDLETAMTATGQVTFDLVLMDMHLNPRWPNEDNSCAVFEAVRRIRTFAGNADLLIIALTADTGITSRTAYLEAGLDGVIAKPLNLDSGLSGAVAAAIESARG